MAVKILNHEKQMVNFIFSDKFLLFKQKLHLTKTAHLTSEIKNKERNVKYKNHTIK